MGNQMNRSKKILRNSAFGVALEAVGMISGIILPRLIIGAYGSAVNGLLTSIAQFLAVFTLFDSGIGGVAKAALYKPLSEGDTIGVSRVVKATSVFFRKVAFCSAAYIAVLAVSYPLLAKSTFPYLFVAALISILGVQSVVRYIFGLPYGIVLNADQKEYIQSSFRIVTITLNLIFSAALILSGCSVITMEIVSGLIFIARPIAIWALVVRKYGIDRKVEPETRALKQKWHGMGYSVSSFIHKKTDVFILTFMRAFKDISVYGVHLLVLHGLDSIIGNITSAIQPAFGNMIARNETENLRSKFRVSVLLTHIVAGIVFSVTLVQLSPFVLLYVKNVTDVDYYRPTFALLISVAEYIFCLRRPYQAVVVAAGHYKQTSVGAYVEAGINIVISLLLVKPLGLTGIAIGTVSSMSFRITYYAWYLRSNLVNLPFSEYLKRIGITAGITVLIVLGCRLTGLQSLTWYTWIRNSVLYTLIAIAVTLCVNWLAYRKTMRELFAVLKHVFSFKKRKG